MEYVVVRFPPEIAKDIIRRWYDGKWNPEDWQEFSREVVELLEMGIREHSK